jgi:hypothetical protein
MARSRLGSVLALAAGILITTGGCAESPSAPTAADASALVMLRTPQGPSFSRSGGDGVAKAIIGPQGGSISLAEGHRLVFPAGALSAPTEISMQADAKYVGVHLEPHGLRFPAGASPVLTLNASGSTAGFSRFAVVYVDEAGQIAEVLPTRTQGGVLRTELEHFSGYIGTGSRQESADAP